MTEFDFTHKFFDWALQNRSELKPTVSALYFYLIMVCKKLGYRNEFSISAKECMEGMGVSSYKTYRAAFETLVNNGFVQVVTKSFNQHQANIIHLCGSELIAKGKEDKPIAHTPQPKAPPTPPVAEETTASRQGDLFGFEDKPQAPPPLTDEQRKKADKAKKYKYGEFVTLTRDEYAKLCAEYSEDGAKRMIEILDNYKGSKGRKYKSDYRAILNWVVDRYNEEMYRHGQTNCTTAPANTEQAAGKRTFRDTL